MCFVVSSRGSLLDMDTDVTIVTAYTTTHISCSVIIFSNSYLILNTYVSEMNECYRLSQIVIAAYICVVMAWVILKETVRLSNLKKKKKKKKNCK